MASRAKKEDILGAIKFERNNHVLEVACNDFLLQFGEQVAGSEGIEMSTENLARLVALYMGDLTENILLVMLKRAEMDKTSILIPTKSGNRP
jgi:hypothetical protein